jgi:DNA-binding response OmpR family regulator
MKGKILIVDDEETMRRSLADILRLEGAQVKVAASGEAAVDALRQNNFDLILLDLKMPGMDGLEVLRVANKIAPETQVILLTAHGSLESAIAALRLGAHDYLLKPASPSQIIRSVTSGLARHAEQLRKHELLEQLEVSVQQLKGVENSQPTSIQVSSAIRLSGGITIDLARRQIAQGDHKIVLTPTEGKLLKVLLENRKRVFTHRELVLLVQGYETSDWEAPEVLRPLISRLRRKLVTFPGGEKWITNVRGVGYVFDGMEGSEGNIQS